MNFKIVPPFPPTPSFSGSDEIISNCWPLPRRPKKVHPEGIPILFREEEVGKFGAEPIAWPCDDATSRWITEDLEEPFSGAIDDPETDQPFEF